MYYDICKPKCDKWYFYMALPIWADTTYFDKEIAQKHEVVIAVINHFES